MASLHTQGLKVYIIHTQTQNSVIHSYIHIHVQYFLNGKLQSGKI